MALNLKTFQELFRQISGKFTQERPGLDPAILASLVRGISGSSAAAGVGLQDGIKDALNQAFWQTADEEFLNLIGEYDKTIRFDEQPASGKASVEGVNGTSVPFGTALTANGNEYTTTTAAAVQQYTDSVSLSLSGGIVTAVTSAEHSLASGLEVTISGATQTDYNGTFIITVLDENTFTYELTAGSLTSDSGDYSAVYALLNVESSDTGTVQNIDSGGLMSISVVDLDDTAYVGVDGISGGLDEESEEAYRERVGENHSLSPGVASPPSVRASAKEVAGNTRVFIVRPEFGVTGGTAGQAGYRPQFGEAVVYILRDDDSSITPSQPELDTTKQKILDDGHWPTFLDDDRLYVLAPILSEQDFVFTNIVPNTTTMQNAIREQLVSFFEDNAEIEGTITLSQIDSFLEQVQDPSTGAFLEEFTYTTPSADIVAGSGEIYTSGTVTFS